MIRIASLSVVFLLICQQALTQVVGEIKNVRFYKWKYKDSVTYEMMVTNEAFTTKIFTGLVSAPATVRVRFLGAKNTEAIIQFNTEITKDIYDGNEIFLVGGRRAGMTFIKGEVGTKVPTFYCVFVHNMNGELLNGAVTQENFIDKLMDGEADGIQFTQPVVELQPDVTYAKESMQAKFNRFYNKNDKLYARIDEYIDSHTEDGMSGDELIAKLTKGQKNIFDEEQSAPQTRSGYRESLEDIFYNGDHPFNFKFQNSDGVMITTGRVEFLLSIITAFYDHPNGNRYFERYELPNKIIKNITIESRAIDGQFSEVVVTLPEKIKTSVEKSARVAGPFEMTNKMHFFMSTGRIEKFKKLITGYLSVTY